VEECVRPSRIVDKNKLRREKWWQFERHAKDLYASLTGLRRCLVTPEVAKHLIFTWQAANLVFASTCNVVATEDPAAFALIQSSIHEVWARRPGLSTLETRPRYNPELCFRTFPLPEEWASARVRQAQSQIGGCYFDFRSKLTKERHEGLTTTYNRFHDR